MLTIWQSPIGFRPVLLDENGMTGNQADIYLARITELDELPIMWPPAREEYAARRKETAISILHDIAKLHPPSTRPNTFIVSPPPQQAPNLPISPRNGQLYIMKRSLSDSGRHYLGPEAVNALPPELIDEMRSARHPWRWLIQTYVPYLRTIGVEISHAEWEGSPCIHHCPTGDPRLPR